MPKRQKVCRLVARPALRLKCVCEVDVRRARKKKKLRHPLPAVRHAVRLSCLPFKGQQVILRQTLLKYLQIAYRVDANALKVARKLFCRLWPPRHVRVAKQARRVFARRRLVRPVRLLHQRYVHALLLGGLKRAGLQPCVLNHDAPERRQFVGLKQ